MLIDNEFRAYCPKLREEEYTQLRENLRREGCRDPLVIWQEQDILVDGHNRYDLCQEMGIGYDMVPLSFPDRDTALDWVINNQLGRRNLSPDQASLLRGIQYNRAKQQGRRTDLTSRQNGEKSPAVAECLAKKHGVSGHTIERDGTFASAVEQVKRIDPDVQRRILDGRKTVKSAVVAAARLLERDPEKAAAVLSGKKRVAEMQRELREAARQARRQANAQRIAATVGVAELSATGARFATIVLDPPWDWGDEGDCDQLGRARPTYGTMPLEELLELPVGTLADADCHLYLWITNRSLPKGFALLEKWGFRYVTMLTWCKPSFGMGNYFRGATEHVLFGIRGSQPLRRKDVGTWFSAPRGPLGHSSKPVEFYDLVESCSPGPYLEMFARGNRDGWTSWGADANGG
jgi:N6-adenosine-specific RNA methylase IME4